MRGTHRPGVARIASTAAIVAIAGCVTAYVHAATAQERYDRLFAPRELQVRATPKVDDDIALAREMVEHMKQHTDDEMMLVLLSRKVAELVRLDVAGYVLAAESHLLVAQHVPERLEESVDQATKLIERVQRLGDEQQKRRADEMWLEAQALLARGYVDTRQYDAAKLIYDTLIHKAEQAGSPKVTELRREVRLIESRKKVLKLADQMRADVSKQAPLSRALMWIYVLELDDPTNADRYARPAGDFTVGPYFALAAKPVDKLTAAEASKLGDWYTSLIEQAEVSEHADAELRRDTARRRAVACYERFLTVYLTKDPERKRIAAALGKLTGRPVADADVGADAGDGTPSEPPNKPTQKPGDNPFLDVVSPDKSKSSN